MAIYKKWWFKKDVVIGGMHVGQIRVVSHHLQSLLGASKLTVLHAFICRVGCFDARIKETLMYR